MTDVRALLKEARALARARRERTQLRYRIYGGLSPNGSELAFFGGACYRPDEGEAVEDFWFRVAEAADGPVIFGSIPDLPRKPGEPELRWKATIEPPRMDTPGEPE
jgi:hypothetical protein